MLLTILIIVGILVLLTHVAAPRANINLPAILVQILWVVLFIVLVLWLLGLAGVAVPYIR